MNENYIFAPATPNNDQFELYIDVDNDHVSIPVDRYTKLIQIEEKFNLIIMLRKILRTTDFALIAGAILKGDKDDA